MTQSTPNTQGASWEEFRHFLSVFEDRFMGGKTCKDGEETCVCAITEFLSKEVPDLLSKERAEGERREQKLLDALESMYEQYCSHGHSFMRAGEYASAVLKEYGYSFDGGGRLKSYPTLPADSTEE